MAEKGACSKKEGRAELQFNLDGNASMWLSIFCCGSLGSKGRLHRRHLYKKGEAYLAGLKEGAKFTGAQEPAVGGLAEFWHTITG